MGDIGAAIEEVMESYEIELDGKVHPLSYPLSPLPSGLLSLLSRHVS
jgi:hypothetical protein